MATAKANMLLGGIVNVNKVKQTTKGNISNKLLNPVSTSCTLTIVNEKELSPINSVSYTNNKLRSLGRGEAIILNKK